MKLSTLGYSIYAHDLDLSYLQSCLLMALVVCVVSVQSYVDRRRQLASEDNESLQGALFTEKLYKDGMLANF